MQEEGEHRTCVCVRERERERELCVCMHVDTCHTCTCVFTRLSLSSPQALIAEGKIKYAGISEATADEIRRAHAVCPLSAVQLEWSLWSRVHEVSVVECLTYAVHRARVCMHACMHGPTRARHYSAQHTSLFAAPLSSLHASLHGCGDNACLHVLIHAFAVHTG